jgi:hypothetical protein
LVGEGVGVPEIADDQTETETADNPGPPLPAVLAGRFRLGPLLGRGAMGRVFEALDEKLQVPVALKLLIAEVQEQPAFLEDLRREIVVARKITHPNVCRVNDLGTHGQLSFLTMELIRGETLERVLTRGSLPSGQTGEILEQVCLALEAAHREGVVHRDLKPGNIMLDASRKVTVMDFGLARDLGGSASYRKGPIGTPAYWSPEQARGEMTTFRSDLYAVGLIAYEMFTSTRLAHVLSDEAPLEKIPRPFRAVLRTCLQIDPGRRFESAAALRRAIHDARSAADFAPVRSRWPLAAACAAVVATLLAGAVAFRAHSRSPGLSPPVPVATPAPAPPPKAEPLPAVALEPQRVDPSPAAAPSPPPLEPAADPARPRRRIAKPAHTPPLDRNRIPVFE